MGSPKVSLPTLTTLLSLLLCEQLSNFVMCHFPVTANTFAYYISHYTCKSFFDLTCIKSVQVMIRLHIFPAKMKIWTIHVNLFQKHLFLHQLTHNMTKDQQLFIVHSTSSVHENYMLRTCFLFWHSEQFMYTICSELVIFMSWTCNFCHIIGKLIQE